VQSLLHRRLCDQGDRRDPWFDGRHGQMASERKPEEIKIHIQESLQFMNMSEENKHNSFFPAEDSPIPVPPAGKAWSLMKQKLDAGMPVAAHGRIWFRGVRGLTPAMAGVAVTGAVVAVVLVGVSIWLATRKPLHREADLLKVERADAARPGDLTRRGDSGVRRADAGAARRVDAGAELADSGRGTAFPTNGVDRANDKIRGAGEVRGNAVDQGNAVDRGKPVDRGNAMDRANAVNPANPVNRANAMNRANTVDQAGAVNRNKDKAVRHGSSRPGFQKEKPGDAREEGTPALGRVDARSGGMSAHNARIPPRTGEPNVQGEGVAAGGRPVTGHERHRGGQGKADVPPLATVQSGGFRDPTALAASLAAELKARQRAWSAAASSAKGNKSQPGKGVLQPGKGLQQAGKATAGQTPAGTGERILAAGIWDGVNFAVNDQVIYRFTSSDGPDLLPDHLPGAYLRLYMGDRAYVEAGLRIFSPQYTRLQRIDSTGDTTSVTPTLVVVTDSIVTLKKLYYTDIPLTIHYRVFAGLYLGGGVQYSRLWDGAAVQKINTMGAFDLDLKNQPATLAKLQRNDWRVLLDASYVWKRLTLGLRYQEGLGSYLRTAEQGSKPHNSSLSLSLSYDIWRQQHNK
jgi:hypothetical protein